MKFFGIRFSRDIHRVQVAHALRSVALSFVSVYVPIFLLSHGSGLQEVILFYVAFHLFGLAAGLFLVVPSMRRYGLTRTLRFSLLLSLLFFLTLNLIPVCGVSWPLVALVGGAANLFYWLPLNILLLRHSEEKSMGSDLGGFFALPKIFGIVGPIISALLIPFLGFWPIFLVSAVGLVVSYLPLLGVGENAIMVDIRPGVIWSELRRRKSLFFLEAFDNIIEESEWFWGIFVFLVVGSLSAPGLVGGIESLGGALFALLVGRYANRHMKKILIASSFALATVWVARFFIETSISAYVVTLVASFVMMAFLVSYMGTIYRKVKRDDEETFIVLREIPTTIGRMVVFGGILLAVSEPRRFFLLPIAAIFVVLAVFAVRGGRIGFRAERAS